MTLSGLPGTRLGTQLLQRKQAMSSCFLASDSGQPARAVPACQGFSGAAATTKPVNLGINNVSVVPTFAGLSEAGLYQINLTIPPGVGRGDVLLQAMVGGVQTLARVAISLN